MTSSTSSSDPASGSTTPRPARVAAAILAIVLPLVIGLTYVLVLGAPEPTTKDPNTLRFERALAPREPDVILLGASKLATDIDKAALATDLGLPKGAVVSLGWSGTTAPLWYAIAENRVFRAGHHPKLIVVYSTFDWTLSVAVGDLQRGYLMPQLGEDEPVIDRKVLGRESSNPTFARVMERKGSVRDHMTAYLRDLTVGVLFAEHGADGIRAAGREVAGPALEALFGMEAGVDLSRIKRAIPVAEAARAPEESRVAHVDDTLVPDFVDLVRENGSRIVFVQAPVRGNFVHQYEVDPALLRETVAYLNTHGAGYLDLQALHLPDASFGDANHLNRTGRDQLTPALADGLRAIDAMGDGPVKPTTLREPFAAPVVAREGTPPTLPAAPVKRGANICDWTLPVPAFEALNDIALSRAQLGMVSPLVLLEDGAPLRGHAAPPDFNDACTGSFQHQGRVLKFSPTGANADAALAHTYTLGLASDVPVRDATRREGYWVYPGTTLRFVFPEAPPPQAEAITLHGLAFGGSGVTARVDGGAAVALTGAGAHASVTLPLTARTGPWELAITSPPTGPYLLLRQLVVGAGPEAHYAIGNEGGTSVSLLTAGDATYAAPPSPLAPLPAPSLAEGGVQQFDIAAYGVPDTKLLYRLASVAGCSPVRLTASGNPLAFAATPATIPAGGGYAQVGHVLMVSPGIQAPVAALDPARKCRALRWLYPGDTLTLTASPSGLAALLGRPDHVAIGGAAIIDGASDAVGEVRVYAGDTLQLDTRFPLSGLNGAPPSWPLDPPLPFEDAPVRLELHTPADGPWVLVSSVTLSEAGPTAGGAAP